MELQSLGMVSRDPSITAQFMDSSKEMTVESQV